MRLCHFARGLIGLSALLGSACSETPSGPSTLDLQGLWRMTFTATDGGYTCRMHDISLIFDSTSVNPQFMTGGTGRCFGRGRDDSVFQNSSTIDSLTVGGGKIRFRVFIGWLFEGRIRSADSVDGTTTQDLIAAGIGQVHLVGPWGAHRRPPLP